MGCGVSSTGGGGQGPEGGKGAAPLSLRFLNESLMIPHFLEYLKGFLALALPNSFSTPLVGISDKHSSKSDSRACSTILFLFFFVTKFHIP